MKNWGRLSLKAMAALMLPGSLVVGISLARAGTWGPATPLAGILPPEDILAAVRYFGLDPEGPVIRRDGYYVLHAFDGTGTELRVVADAKFGDILFLGPAFNASLTPPYIRAAHIIHVPQPGESEEKKK
jgi:hypothetical protein